jgi:N6-adenosine-specific RNA methylase IME4
MEAWGFEYKTNIAWVKPKSLGFSWWVKPRHELLLIGVRANAPQPIETPDSALFFSRGEHSEKPEEFYGTIESMYLGAKIELFARQPREGWVAYGNEPAIIDL